MLLEFVILVVEPMTKTIGIVVLDQAGSLVKSVLLLDGFSVLVFLSLFVGIKTATASGTGQKPAAGLPTSDCDRERQWEKNVRNVKARHWLC